MNNTTPIHSSENYVLAEQVKLLFANAKVSNISLIIVAFLMAIALWDLLPHWVFFSWLAFAFTAAATWLIFGKSLPTGQ